MLYFCYLFFLFISQIINYITVQLRKINCTLVVHNINFDEIYYRTGKYFQKTSRALPLDLLSLSHKQFIET